VAERKHAAGQGGVFRVFLLEQGMHFPYLSLFLLFGDVIPRFLYNVAPARISVSNTIYMSESIEAVLY